MSLSPSDLNLLPLITSPPPGRQLGGHNKAEVPGRPRTATPRYVLLSPGEMGGERLAIKEEEKGGE